MTAIKPSDHGIVVDHVESGMRFAISDRNYNVKVHRKVRDLRPGESVLSYQPRAHQSLSSAVEDSQDPSGPEEGAKSSSQTTGTARTTQAGDSGHN